MSIVSNLQCSHVAARLRRRNLAGPSSSYNRKLAIRATYDVEVESGPSRAPNNAPRFGGGTPPPPPPPPQPQQTSRGPQLPTRREMLFGALGLGLGVAGTYTYDNRPLDQEEVDERLTEILDELLNDEALLNVLGEEIILNKTLAQSQDAVTALEGLKQIDDALGSLLDNVGK